MANNGPSTMLDCRDGMENPADCGTLTDGCCIELQERVEKCRYHVNQCSYLIRNFQLQNYYISS